MKLGFFEKLFICATPLQIGRTVIADNKLAGFFQQWSIEEASGVVAAAAAWHGFTLLPVGLKRSLILMSLSSVAAGCLASMDPIGVSIGTFCAMGAWLLYRHWFMGSPSPPTT